MRSVKRRYRVGITSVREREGARDARAKHPTSSPPRGLVRQVSEIPAREKGAHFKLYYERDLKLMRASVPQLARFCARFTFELVLIDGNEYTGW